MDIHKQDCHMPDTVYFQDSIAEWMMWDCSRLYWRLNKAASCWAGMEVQAGMELIQMPMLGRRRCTIDQLD